LPNSSSVSVKPVLALALLCLVWGYAWVVLKIALQYAGVFDFTGLRTVASTVLLFIIVIAMRRPLRIGAWRAAVVVGTLQTGGFLLFSMWALSLGGAGRTSVLVYTMPFWTLIFAWLILGERMRGLQWLAAILAFCGLMLIVAPWDMQGTLIASLSAVTAGALWSLGTVLGKKMMPKDSIDLLTFSAWQMLVAAVPLAIAAWLVPSAPIRWTTELVVCFLYATVLGSVLGWFLWFYVLNHMAAGVATLNALAIPVIAVASAWLQLEERPPPHELAGMLLIGVGLALLGAIALRQNRIAGGKKRKTMSGTE
jgi:drug/metabolite transporter (DMT)-like permease